MQLEPGTAIDRYVVEGRLGQGGVASVYRVRHEGLGTVHALKVVHIPSPAITERLLREGRAQGRLRHANVVSVTDLVSVRGAPGLVMELVPGPALDHFLETTPLSLEEADALARGILAGVAAAHRAGLVHRDLKPGNVLLELSDGQITPKIVDFGLAKALTMDSESPLQTRAGASLGTPAYMAPEQIDDASRVDERADVFALGAILFELVAGQRAFMGDSVPEIYANIRIGAHTPIPDHLPARMQRTIRLALSVDLSERPASVEEVLRLWADDTPVPRVTWSAQALEAASPAPGPAPIGERTPSTSTFGGNELRTTHETWTGEDHELVSTVEGGELPPPPTRKAGWTMVVVAASVLLAAGWWTLAPLERPVDVLRVDATPTLAEPALQRQFDEAWTAYLSGDFPETVRRLHGVREQLPDAPLPHLLSGAALMFEGDVPASLEAFTDARTSAAAQPDAPGAGLVDVFRELQLQGKSVGPPLDAWIEAHPDDYLARQMRAQYCSTTSKVDVCERAHQSLLEHDDRELVAHLTRARAWLDLGELERVREATADGLAIDPLEPGLLSLQGAAWMSEGEVEEARKAYQRSLDADPRRRGPKVALAQLSLLANDGSWDAVTAELLAPTVPSAMRVEVHTEAAETLHGLGQVTQALAHLELAQEIEEREGTPLGVLTVLSKVAPPIRLRGQPDELTTLIDAQLRLVATSPEIPNPVRNRYASYGPWAEGIAAAQAGDREGLDKAIERVQAAEFDQSGVTEALLRERAIMSRDLEAIASHAGAFWTDCDRHTALGEAYRRADAPERAMEQWQGVLESGCRLHRPARANVVLAHLGLAELGDGEARAAHLAAIAELWPRPDSNLPPVMRIERLKAE